MLCAQIDNNRFAAAYVPPPQPSSGPRHPSITRSLFLDQLAPSFKNVIVTDSRRSDSCMFVSAAFHTLTVDTHFPSTASYLLNGKHCQDWCIIILYSYRTSSIASTKQKQAPAEICRTYSCSETGHLHQQVKKVAM